MHTYILVKGTITVPKTEKSGTPNNRIQKQIFKDYVPFTNCLRKMTNKQLDNAKDIDSAIPMYNLLEYSDIYSKPSGFYSNIAEMSQLQMLLTVIFLILMQLILLLICLKLKKK